MDLYRYIKHFSHAFTGLKRRTFHHCIFSRQENEFSVYDTTLLFIL